MRSVLPPERRTAFNAREGAERCVATLADLVGRFPDDGVGGHAYFIQAGAGHVKIGFSKNPEQRVAALRRQDGDSSYRLLASVTAAGRVEASVHDALHAHRYGNGEWFLPDAEVLAFAEQAKARTARVDVTGRGG